MEAQNRVKNNKTGKKNDLLKDSLMDKEVIYEFGGPIGAACLILFSHFIMIYLWASIEFFDGEVFLPSGFSDIGNWFARLFKLWYNHALPTTQSIKIYGTFIFIELVLAIVIPGLEIKGLPVPSEGYKQLKYNCNAIHSWYILIGLAAVLQYFKLWSLAYVIDNFAPLLTTSMLAANILSVVLYISAFVTKKTYRMSGNHLYDFFMGASLNPRFFNVDLKMWAEVRVSWALLFFLTLSAAVKQYEIYGVVSCEMFIMVLAHWLYANACHKGEHCIPTTWDIFYEKWGWMIIFWNLSGVPFVYSFQSRFILKHHPVGNHTYFNVSLILVLLIAYYIWDTANAQKNQFRMIEHGTYVKRNTFPQLPWGVLKNPRYLNTEHGNKLLTDGWYRWARKIHYSADTLMGLIWGMSCGFNHFLPYFYVCFFTGMIIHRYLRDQHRCMKKYGNDWEKYCKIVPYVFIPYIY
jgi:delta24(24(1))-sterol reductase